MRRRFFQNHSGESGQVLVAGIFILIILLLLVFAGFDIHNAIRAKFKIQTAQESAAIAGATWQKHSLNLIGEINLVKACSLLLEGDNQNWRIPLPPQQPPQSGTPQSGSQMSARDNALQARVDILTEMQTRISFIGPLIGFAAAQQAAKANGVPVLGDLEFYYEDLQNNIRYREESGVKQFINRYEWRPAYMELIRTISANKIAVYPNTTANSNPRVDPPELADPAFYRTIHQKNGEIQRANGGAIYPQTSWNMLKKFVYRDQWAERFENPPWWDIDFNARAFPNESEIFTLGVGKIDRYPYAGQPEFDLLRTAVNNTMESANANSLYGAGIPRPNIKLNMFCYEQDTWDPEYLRSVHSDYDAAFFNYWFKGTVLRKPVRERYIYEGPAAYVETHVNVDKVSSIVKVSGQKHYGGKSIRIGSNREDQAINLTTSYRPGAIAKALGSLDSTTPPIALPLVLPVFDKVVIMPTYMPIPYGFSVLRDYNSPLRRFLAWLSTQQNLDSNAGLPSICTTYLEALRILVKGPEFRYYGWNPNFDATEFDDEWHEDLKKWHTEREQNPSKYQYSINSGQTLPGYYQEPNIFTACPKTTVRSGIVTVPTYNLNGSVTGSAKRHFIDNKGHYMVVTSSKHIITRVESDPTWDPNCCTTNYNPPSGGGPGNGSHYVPSSGVSTQPWYGL